MFRGSEVRYAGIAVSRRYAIGYAGIVGSVYAGMVGGRWPVAGGIHCELCYAGMVKTVYAGMVCFAGSVQCTILIIFNGSNYSQCFSTFVDGSRLL